jgi:hypothetical protein
MRTILAGTLVMGVTIAGITIPVAARAGTVSPTCTRHGSAAGSTITVQNLAQAVGTATGAMRSRGMSRGEIDQTLATDWCIHKISKPVVGVNGTGDGVNDGDVQWLNKGIYYDENFMLYVAIVEYEWRNSDWSSDFYLAPWEATCTGTGIGGTDAFGLRMDGVSMWILGDYEYVIGNRALNDAPNNFRTTRLEGGHWSEYGVGFATQDVARYAEPAMDPEGQPNGCGGPLDLNMYGGYISIAFLPSNTTECRDAQVFPEYVHTWDSTGVTGIGAGAEGFNIQWQNYGHEQLFGTYGEHAVVCPRV